MDLLCQIPTKRGVRKALEILPHGIDKTYSEAWHRVCTQGPHQAELGKRILSWIIHATRPLRVQELRHALAIEDNDEEIDADGLLDVEKLTSFCAGLVIVDGQRGLFSLVHPTTQEYFDKHKNILFPDAHEKIAATCMTYLRMKPFRDEGALDDFDAFYKRCCTCHLLGYAAVDWGLHAALAGSEKQKDDSFSLLSNESVRAAAWQALQLNYVGAQEFGPEWPSKEDALELFGVEFDTSRSFSVALHVAAYFGLISVVQIFLELGNDMDQLDGTGRTPLHWAILGNQNTTLEFLLEHGANANAEIANSNGHLRRWYTASMRSLPLAQAALLDNRFAIECLLHHGAEINNRGRSGKETTALSTALYHGCRSTTQVLLENEADVNVDIGGLNYIAEYGNWELMKMAVDAGASNYNIQQTLASAAAGSNYEAIVFLVGHGANANGFTVLPGPCHETDRLSIHEAQTPLVASAASCFAMEDQKSFQCFRYLLDSGADVNRVCARRWWHKDDQPKDRKTTALHTAAYHGRLDMVRVLVERSADVNLSLGEQHTALSSALGSEGYAEKYDKMFHELRPTSSLRARATINVLVDLGADPQLCKDEEMKRIETLRKMSPDNCKMLAALQTVVEQLGNPDATVYEKKSFRDSINELKELIAGGANPDLCCDRDKRQIGRFLAWSEEKIDTIDEHRRAELALCAEYEKRPI